MNNAIIKIIPSQRYKIVFDIFAAIYKFFGKKFGLSGAFNCVEGYADQIVAEEIPHFGTYDEMGETPKREICFKG